MAEWLRRWPAKPLCIARVGSNPTGVAFFKFPVLRKLQTLNIEILTRANSNIQISETKASIGP